MDKRWAVFAVVLLMVAALGPAIGAQEAAEEPKFVLAVTDGGNWLLPWIQAVSVYPFDPAADPEQARGAEAVAKIDSPADPITFSLPSGDYEIVITVLKYGIEPMGISVGHVKLSADIVVDLLEAKIPFELFLPA